MMELRLKSYGPSDDDPTQYHWRIEGTYDFVHWVILCEGESNWAVAEVMVQSYNNS